MELRPQSGVDALSGLVAGPELIAEGFDDVIGRHADVRGSPLDRLQHRPEHPGHGAERRVLALVEAAETVEVTEELVGAVDEMNDHGCMVIDRASGKAPRFGSPPLIVRSRVGLRRIPSKPEKFASENGRYRDPVV